MNLFSWRWSSLSPTCGCPRARSRGRSLWPGEAWKFWELVPFKHHPTIGSPTERIHLPNSESKISKFLQHSYWRLPFCMTGRIFSCRKGCSQQNITKSPKIFQFSKEPRNNRLTSAKTHDGSICFFYVFHVLPGLPRAYCEPLLPVDLWESNLHPFHSVKNG